jgi:hypothetical protein
MWRTHFACRVETFSTPAEALRPTTVDIIVDTVTRECVRHIDA